MDLWDLTTSVLTPPSVTVLVTEKWCLPSDVVNSSTSSPLFRKYVQNHWASYISWDKNNKIGSFPIAYSLILWDVGKITFSPQTQKGSLVTKAWHRSGSSYPLLVT